MKVLRQIGVLTVLLATCLAPTLACAVPGAQMNAQERACCRTMSKQCGKPEMPASHGCCQKTPASLYAHALSTKAVAVHPVVVPVLWLTPSELVNPIVGVTASVERPDYSPPLSPPSTVSILRI